MTQVWVKPQRKVPAVREATPKVKTAFHFPARTRTSESVGDNINCPHCSATNSISRELCWSCWAELHPAASTVQPVVAVTPPPEAVPAEIELLVIDTTEEAQPEVFELPEEFVPGPTAAIVAESVTLPRIILPEIEIAATVAENVIDAKTETEEIIPEAEDAQPKTIPIVEIADDVIFAQTKTPTVWYAVLPVALVALVLGAMLCWNFWLQPRMSVVQITRITQTYLSALEQGDINTQTHLATQASKGIRLPGWITIGGATLLEPKSVQKDIANYEVELRLIPSEDKAEQIAELRKALSHQYQLEIVLRFEDGKWLVDQQRLAQDLRKQLTEENPGLTFPKW
ncbi:MAG: hypothetical protein WCJ56_05575 [bacterium]